MHYAYAFLAISALFMVIMRIFTNLSLHEIIVSSTFALLIIWIPPVFDLASSGIGGHTIGYIFVSGPELLARFTMFFGANTTTGATLGVQLEIILALIICFTYIFLITKNIWRSLGATISFYCAIFFLFNLPSFIALALPAGATPFDTIARALADSNIIQNNIHPEWSTTRLALVHLGFNKAMAGVHIIIVMLSVVLLAYLDMRTKFIAVAKNSRVLRLACYCLMFVFGSLLAGENLGGWVDIQGYILALISIVCACIFSICQNDLHDEEIDRISNASRPLVSGKLSREDMSLVSKIFLLFSLMTAYVAGHYVLVFISIFILLYYIYSNPPLRLKRIPILSSLLIGLACMSLIMAGFFLMSEDKNIVAFPVELILPTILLFTLASSIRDIKDVEGDSASGIYTLPVLLGVEKTKKLLGGLMFIPILISPVFFDSATLWLPAIVTSILSWYFINAKNYAEWKIFVLYIIYFTIIIVSVF